MIFVPLIWVLVRKGNATDHEGRGKAPPELAEPTSKKIGLPGIDYKWYTMGSEWRHPDFQKYREKLERDEREAEKKGKDALQHA